MRQEFAGAELGDARLHERLGEIVEALAKSPESSFVGMCDTEAEREGLYRFLRNRRVEWKALLGPHVEETVTRARKARRVLVVHDTTEMQVCEQAELRSYLRVKKKGFLAHISLVLDANEERRPLGIAALDTIERKTVSKLRKNGRPMRGDETTKLANREFERWGRGVDATSKLLTDVDELIHVMDAESDSYELLASMHEAGHRFVTRLAHDRRHLSPAMVGRGVLPRIEDGMCIPKTEAQQPAVHLQLTRLADTYRMASALPSTDGQKYFSFIGESLLTARAARHGKPRRKASAPSSQPNHPRQKASHSWRRSAAIESLTARPDG